MVRSTYIWRQSLRLPDGAADELFFPLVKLLPARNLVNLFFLFQGEIVIYHLINQSDMFPIHSCRRIVEICVHLVLRPCSLNLLIICPPLPIIVLLPIFSLWLPATCLITYLLCSSWSQKLLRSQFRRPFTLKNHMCTHLVFVAPWKGLKIRIR
jgi:hypothetical protein